MAVADATLLVADNDKRGETETPAALHHFRDAIDVDQAIHKFAVAFFAVPAAIAAAAFTFTCHFYLPSLHAANIRRSLQIDSSKLQPAFARPFGERLDAPVIHDAEIGDALFRLHVPLLTRRCAGRSAF